MSFDRLDSNAHDMRKFGYFVPLSNDYAKEQSLAKILDLPICLCRITCPTAPSWSSMFTLEHGRFQHESEKWSSFRIALAECGVFLPLHSPLRPHALLLWPLPFLLSFFYFFISFPLSTLSLLSLPLPLPLPLLFHSPGLSSQQLLLLRSISFHPLTNNLHHLVIQQQSRPWCLEEV